MTSDDEIRKLQRDSAVPEGQYDDEICSALGLTVDEAIGTVLYIFHRKGMNLAECRAIAHGLGHTVSKIEVIADLDKEKGNLEEEFVKHFHLGLDCGRAVALDPDSPTGRIVQELNRKKKTP